VVNIVGIKDLPVLKTDTRETEKVFTKQFLLIKGASMYSLQLSRRESTQWMTVASPHILTWLYLPTPGVCPGQRFTTFLHWLKGLGQGT
jgi:hypothetical protein